MTARETALKQLGIEDRCELADHAKIYNAEHGKFHGAPIEMVDASVPYDNGQDTSYGYSPLPSPKGRAARLLAEKISQDCGVVHRATF